MRREAIQNRYETVDYIRSIVAFIDTGVQMTGTKLKIWIDYNKHNNYNGQSLWGASTNDANWCMVPYMNTATSFKLAIGSSGSANTAYISLNQRRYYSAEINTANHTYSVNNNGSVTNGSWSGSVSQNNIYLFAHNCGNNFIWQMMYNIDCYGCKITIDDVDVRDYIPAKDLTTGEVGLYDNCGSICSLTGTPFYIQANRFMEGTI